MSSPSNSHVMAELHIVSVNVNSIVRLNRRDYLNDFLRTQKPDIMLVCETKLTPRHRLTFYNYNLVRQDRRNSILGGGTAILIRKNIKFEIAGSPVTRNFKCLESAGIWISLPNSERICIMSLYASQRNSECFIPEWNSLFTELEFDDAKNYYLLAGDLNAKHSNWLNAIHNTRGNFISRWIIEKQTTLRCRLLGPSIPTYPAGNSYLDIAIADSRLKFRFKNNVNSNGDWPEAFVAGLPVLPYDSDHHAIQINVGFTNNAQFVLPVTEGPLFFNYRKTNWKKFSNHLNRQCLEMAPLESRNLSNIEIDEAIDQLNEVISMSIQYVIPKFRTSNPFECYSPNIFLLYSCCTTC